MASCSYLFPYSSDSEDEMELFSHREDRSTSDADEVEPVPFQPHDEEAPEQTLGDNDDPSTIEQTPGDGEKPSTSHAEQAAAASFPSTSSNSSPGKRKNPYALGLNQLPSTFQRFMRDVKTFFTQKVNLQRQRPPIAASTYDKVQERILCFLGYVRSVTGADVPLREECFLRKPLIEGYVEFLQDERHISAATCANHIAAVLYPAKYVHRESGPDFNGVEIIRQLRALATILQREGDIERPSTREDFEALNRWISWEEVVAAVGMQRDRFEATRPAKVKAKECCDLVLLSLYVYIPPSRGLEIRSLEICDDLSRESPSKRCNDNFLVLSGDGDGEVRFLFNRYKTKRCKGRDELALNKDDELSKILRVYVNQHRPLLVTESSQRFLLLNRYGDPFSGPSFSAHLKTLIHGLTGKLAGVNILRSSFVTWAYGKSDCTDALKTSLAAALRHSRAQAQRTYDRRTANERKQLAVELTKGYAEARLGPEQGEEESPGEGPAAGQNCRVQVGDFVGLVEEGSTQKAPLVLIGRVQCFVGGGEAQLLWYEKVKGGLYKLRLDGQLWTESVRCLVPVRLQALKNRPGLHKLLTSPRQIHRDVLAQSDF